VSCEWCEFCVMFVMSLIHQNWIVWQKDGKPW